MRLSLDWIETPEEARGLLGRWRESVVNGLLWAGAILGIPFWVVRPIPMDQLLTPPAHRVYGASGRGVGTPLTLLV